MELNPQTVVVQAGGCEVTLVYVRLLRKGANRQALKEFGKKEHG